MRIAQARARHFRVFEQFELSAHPRLNLLVGDNGAGKTSALEALFTLGRAAGYRDSAHELLRHGHDAWRVEGRINVGEAKPRTQIGVSFRNGATEIEVDGRKANTLELVRLLPMLVVDPSLHRLLEQGPAFRRRFFDWGVFHVEQDFHSVWQRMRRALKQRNAALKQNHGGAQAWNRELGEPALKLTAMRQAYLEHLEALTRLQLEHLLPGEEWRLAFHAGWNREFDYQDLLEARLERDRRFGHTVDGPHRAELHMYRDGHPAPQVISRGEQKLLIAALSLAQAELVGAALGRLPILFVDDFTAELSVESQRKLGQRLAAYPGQKFITALEPPPALTELEDLAVFHVEHGVMRALIK